MSSCHGRRDQSSQCCSAASSAETSPSTSPSSPLDPAGAGLLSHFGADFVRYRLRPLYMMVEMHRILSPTLAHRPQGIDIPKHVGQWDHCVDNPRVAASVHAGDLAATAVQVADHVTHILLRGYHFDPHYRLEQFWRRFHDAFLERGARRNLERQHAGIDVMISAVEQRRLQIDDREAR